MAFANPETALTEEEDPLVFQKHLSNLGWLSLNSYLLNSNTVISKGTKYCSEFQPLADLCPR